jgi:hypothetical protein
MSLEGQFGIIGSLVKARRGSFQAGIRPASKLKCQGLMLPPSSTM